jgi:Bacterial regulatory helix-turn-helix proteins, AraC family
LRRSSLDEEGSALRLRPSSPLLRRISRRSALGAANRSRITDSVLLRRVQRPLEPDPSEETPKASSRAVRTPKPPVPNGDSPGHRTIRPPTASGFHRHSPTPPTRRTWSHPRRDRNPWRVPTLAPNTQQRVLAHIQAHLATGISLADLAGVAGLSPFFFARAFRASVGETPHVTMDQKCAFLRSHKSRL